MRVLGTLRGNNFESITIKKNSNLSLSKTILTLLMMKEYFEIRFRRTFNKFAKILLINDPMI